MEGGREEEYGGGVDWIDVFRFEEIIWGGGWRGLNRRRGGVGRKGRRIKV